ncbi:WSC domain-containing protein 1 [Mactra antiquata]
MSKYSHKLKMFCVKPGDDCRKTIQEQVSEQDYCKVHHDSTQPKLSNGTQLQCRGNVTFLKTPKPFVALASFPGSGNTWTRQLLEDLTGVYTGSIYYEDNFNGSKVCPLTGGVFIIKTHLRRNHVDHIRCKKLNISTPRSFDQAIIILRNPYDAMIAEFNRRHGRRDGGKLGVVNRTAFTTDAWKSFVKERSENWRQMILYWTGTFNKPYHIVVYEKMAENKCEELMKLAEFLSVDILPSVLNCLLNNDKIKWKRLKPSWVNKETLFDEKLRTIVNNDISKVLKSTSDKNLSSVLINYLFY